MSKVRPRGKSTRTAPRPPANAVALRLSPRAWLAMWRAVAWIAALAVVGWGVAALRDRVHAERPHTPIRLVFVQPPPNEEIAQEILAVIGPVLEMSVFEPDLVSSLGARLARSPWIAEVRRVSRKPSGEVEVDAHFRLPFAYVDAGPELVCLIDADGYRLPWTYTRKQVEDSAQWAQWFCIVGVEAPPPPPGQRWSPRSVRPAAEPDAEAPPPLAPDLEAGIQLAAFFQDAIARREMPFRPLIRAIDVGNFDLREDRWAGRLRLRTISTRGLIHWGLPPGEESGTEPDAQKKLYRLRGYYNQQGGQLPSGYEYDVRPDDGLKSYEYRGR